MDICFKTSQGELRITSNEDLETFIKQHPQLLPIIQAQLNTTEPFTLPYPPKGFTFNDDVNSFSEFSFDNVPSVDLEYSTNHVFSDKVQLPSRKKGAYIKSKNLILYRSGLSSDQQEIVIKHELAHAQFDERLAEPEVKAAVDNVVKALKKLRSKAAQRIKNNADSSAEIIAILYSEPLLVKTLSNNINAKQAIQDLFTILETDPARETISTDEYIDDDEPPFFTDEEDLGDALILDYEGTFEGKKKDANVVYNNFLKTRFAKGYELVVEDGELQLKPRVISEDEENQIADKKKRNWGFMDLFFLPRKDKFQPDFYKNIGNNIKDEELQRRTMKDDWSVLDLESLKQGDAVLLPKRRYNDNKEVSDEYYTEYFPVLYNFPNEGKLMVATPYKYQKDGKTYKKGDRVVLTVRYSDILSFRQLAGKPEEDVVILSENKNDLLTDNAKINVSDGFKKYDPENSFELDLSASMVEPQRHNDTIKEFVEEGDVVRVRHRLSEDYRKGEYKYDYYVKYHKVVAKMANALVVSISSKDDGSEPKLITIPNTLVDRVVKPKNPEHEFRKQYNTRLAQVELEGNAAEKYKRAAGTDKAVVFRPEDGDKFIPFGSMYEKAKDKQERALGIFETVFPGDWIQYVDKNGRKRWGKYIALGNEEVSILSAETKDGDLFSMRIPFGNIQWILSDTTEDRKVLEAEKDYVQALKEEGIITDNQLNAYNKDNGFFDPFFETVTVADRDGKIIDPKVMISKLLPKVDIGDKLTLRYVKSDGSFGLSTVTITHKKSDGSLFYSRVVNDKVFRFPVDNLDIVRFHFIAAPELHSYRSLPAGKNNYYERLREDIEYFRSLKDNNNVSSDNLDFAVEIKDIKRFKKTYVYQNGIFGFTTKKYTDEDGEEVIRYYKTWATGYSKGSLVSKLQNGYIRASTNEKTPIPIDEALKGTKKGDYLAVRQTGRTGEYEAKYFIEDIMSYEDNGQLKHSVRLVSISKNDKLFSYYGTVEDGTLKLRDFGTGKPKMYTISAVGLKGFNRLDKFKKNDDGRVLKTRALSLTKENNINQLISQEALGFSIEKSLREGKTKQQIVAQLEAKNIPQEQIGYLIKKHCS